MLKLVVALPASLDGKALGTECASIVHVFQMSGLDVTDDMSPLGAPVRAATTNPTVPRNQLKVALNLCICNAKKRKEKKVSY